MKNIPVYALLTVYGILYIIGTCVAISKHDMVMTFVNCGSLIFFAGAAFGHWSSRKDGEVWEQVRYPYL